MKPFLLVSIFFIKSSILLAQKDSSVELKLQSQLIDKYIEISNESKENYFRILSKTAEFLPNIDNPNFNQALEHKVLSLNVGEIDALQLVFNELFDSLKTFYLWNPALQISESDSKILNLYFNTLCPCISSKLSSTSPMEEILSTQKLCVSQALTDTSFLSKLRNLASQNALNEMSRLERFLFLKMYEKCELYTVKFNQTIFENSVVSKYNEVLSSKRRSDGLRILDLYNKKKFDSLKLIFPNYANYTKVLTEGVKYISIKTNTIDTYYYGPFLNRKVSRSVLDIHDKNLLGVQLTFNYVEHSLNSKITSVEIKYFKETKKSKPIEIKEDRVIPTTKKN